MDESDTYYPKYSPEETGFVGPIHDLTDLHKIDSVCTLFSTLKRIIGEHEDAEIWYRGQSNCTYPLLPSLYRKSDMLAGDEIKHKELDF